MKTWTWGTACNVCTAGLSVVCMSSMGAAMTATGAARVAGLAGMEGMSANAQSSGLLFLPRLFDSLGLGVLNRLPNAILHPLLVVLLMASVGAAFVAYRGHRRPHPLTLAVASALALYVSIYVWMSDLLYLSSLVGQIGAGVWAMYLVSRAPASGETSSRGQDGSNPDPGRGAMIAGEDHREILATTKTIAVVGLSNKPDRPSYGIAKYLKDAGYKIVPVNPTIKEALGERAYPSLGEVPESVDVVQIFRKSEDVPPIVDDAIAIGAKIVWMQLGIVNEESAARARAAGLKVVMDRCMRATHRALHAMGQL